MKRFYFNRGPGDDNFLIFDHTWSNGIAIATVYDVNVADMVCEALNKFWEKNHGQPGPTTATTEADSR